MKVTLDLESLETIDKNIWAQETAIREGGLSLGHIVALGDTLSILKGIKLASNPSPLEQLQEMIHQCPCTEYTESNDVTGIPRTLMIHADGDDIILAAVDKDGLDHAMIGIKKGQAVGVAAAIMSMREQ